MQQHAATYVKESGAGRMNGSVGQADVCALLCTKQKSCGGAPADAKHQKTAEISANKIAPAQAEQQSKDAGVLSRVSSCPLPDTPQQEAPQLVLPKLRIGDSSSKPKPSTPGAAAAGDVAAAGPGQCPGWFFNCRGCGCMTAYERRIATADVPFCRRCQVLLDDATPEMKGKMVDTLMYVHSAWAKAGL